ncbi:unnamed protein product [Adineta ricciae]|uniref:Uncharacterized protein n=1 Tax=Adineta ricciae TaxID=249248 RepID=A0A815EWW0_ADIRI|nr:unnamed protein product [Adineta ricciae]CAF1317944.1 unnamed protein product [Adineta ricciae]
MLQNVVAFCFCFVLFYHQIIACKLCVINSTCDDDYIHFNISISNDCPRSQNAYFSYQTDLSGETYYVNQTLDCRGCYYDLQINPIHDAWVYYLTFESPKTIRPCALYKAICGGKTSRYVWIVTGGLSGLFMIFGILLCSIRLCRMQSRSPRYQQIQ